MGLRTRLSGGNTKAMDKESRSKIRSDYKQTIRPMGVFSLKNMQNNKVFIGRSMSLHQAYNRLRFSLELNGFMNKELQKEWNEYGAESFKFEILDELKPVDADPNKNYIDDVKELEHLWLEKLQPYGENGYHKQILHKIK